MRPLMICASIGLSLAAAASAQDYELDWWSVDAGGSMWTISSDYELSGTIGQPDAGATMTGGSYELVGGYWVAAPAGPVLYPGDLDCDGDVDFDDIDPFVKALEGQAAYEAMYPDCEWLNGDLDEDGDVDFDDIDPFVELLSG